MTAYGRLLVLKAALVAGISMCGYVNWRRLRAMHEESASPVLVLEAALAAAVAIVTGFLTETGHP
jgi:putative copper export protein